MPEPYECKLCSNYVFCLVFRGEESMRKNPCPYEVFNNVTVTLEPQLKAEKPSNPSIRSSV